MKKIIAIFLTVVMLFSTQAVMAEVIDDLNAINSLPSGVSYEKNSQEFATRQEFAYMVAKILNCGELPAVNTSFSDVDVNNEYSGYIAYLAAREIVNGTSGSTFNPYGELDINAAVKMLVCALDYNELAERKGGYPNGYVEVAMNLGLYKNISNINGKLTKYNSAVMLHNALLAEVIDPYTNSGTVLLCDMLGINAYRGVITDTDTQHNTATFYVENNEYSQNNQLLVEGQTYVLDAGKHFDVTRYERIPAVLWVNEDGEIIHIVMRNNVEVKYGYIASINADTSETGAYPARSIDELMFINDEEIYSVSDDVLVKYNDVYTTSPTKLCARFAKVVIIGGEITFIESFDVSEGGLVTEITTRKIVFTQGEREGVSLNDIDLKKNIRVFIGGEPADIKDLRIGTVIDYYEDNKTLVIVASERVVSDSFSEYSPGEAVTVGTLAYKIKDNLYTSENGINFTKNSKVAKLIGSVVRLYIAPSGYAKYMVLEDEISASNEFYAIVEAVDNTTVEYETSANVLLVKISGSTTEELVCKITEKTKHNGYANVEALIEAVSANAGDLVNGNCVYIVKINDNNEIVSFSEPSYFYGTDGKSTSNITSFYNEESGRLSANSLDIRFDKNVPMIYLTKVDGKFVTGVKTWSDFANRSGSGLKAKFFGEGKIAQPEWVFLYGDIGSYTKSSKTYYGLYCGYTIVFNEHGESVKRIKIITNDGLMTYDVSDEIAKELEDATGGAGLIQYTADVFSSTKNVVLKNTLLKLNSDTDEWFSDNQGKRIKSGVVEKVAGNRVYFEDGSAHYTNNYDVMVCYASLKGNAIKKNYKAIEFSELEPGDFVYYLVDSVGKFNMIIKLEQ